MKTISRRPIQNDATPDLAQLHPVLQRVLQARGIQTAIDLDKRLQGLLPFHTLLNIDEAARQLAQAIISQKRILLVGDFDADGATSVAVAIRALRLMGAQNVHYLVPNRFEYGYGLTPEIVKVAQGWQPDIIVTVDNGISSVQGVDTANAAGISVIITDHHLPGEILPRAAAIVNPNQHGDNFPSKNLAGVGVIFYVMLALRAQLRELNWFAQNNKPDAPLAELLDLVALGTVADVVPLDHNNRILVHQGLQRIRQNTACAGVKALLQVAGRKCEKLVAGDLGFAIAPRLNAAGRLQDMSLGIECLLSDNLSDAIAMATQLDTLNQERRAIEGEMQIQAMDILQNLWTENDKTLPTGICLYEPEWHQGVIGILAARVKERFNRPVICFAKTDNDMLKGSARSIEGLHMRDLLEIIATQHPDLMPQFGGHAMAAGLLLPVTHFDKFSQLFDITAKSLLTEEILQNKVYTDGEIAPHEFTIELAEVLKASGPWGQHFPEPLFDGIFQLLNPNILKEKHVKCQLKPQGSNILCDAIAFNVDFNHWPKGISHVRAAYRLDVNEFRGKRSLQLIIEQIEAI